MKSEPTIEFELELTAEVAEIISAEAAQDRIGEGDYIERLLLAAGQPTDCA